MEGRRFARTEAGEEENGDGALERSKRWLTVSAVLELAVKEKSFTSIPR